MVPYGCAIDDKVVRSDGAPVYVLRVTAGEAVGAPFDGAISHVHDGAYVVFQSRDGYEMTITDVKMDNPDRGRVDGTKDPNDRWSYVNRGDRIGTTTQTFVRIVATGPGGGPADAILLLQSESAAKRQKQEQKPQSSTTNSQKADDRLVMIALAGLFLSMNES